MNTDDSPGLYKEDGKFIGPGFDCDDYAEAMAEWLRRKYPNAELWTLGYFWFGDGHAVTVIRIDGYFYMIDPQTGVISGPFATTDEVHASVKKLMKDWYGVSPGWADPFERYRWRDPSARPELIEPGPWYTDPEIKEHFRNNMPNPPEDYMPKQTNTGTGGNGAS